MLGWFKHVQELTNDLRKAAKVILDQRPHSLKWASNRLWEFAGILAHEHGLLPDRVHNGLDFTGSSREDEDDLVFFDHYYGVGKDVYASDGVSLRLGLQCYEGRRPISFVEVQLKMDVRDEEDEKTICDGDITLVGRRGARWIVRARFAKLRDDDVGELEEHFGALIPSGCFSNRNGATVDVAFDAKVARKFFEKMVQYFLAKQG